MLIAARRGGILAFGAQDTAWQIVIAVLHCIALSAMPAGAATTAQDGITADAALARAIKRVAHPLTGAPTDYDRLLQKIGDARIVLLGEDTHGTHEFYAERARITRRLIAEHGFSGVVIEADWSEAAGLSAFLTAENHPADVDLALRAFERFPRWMWRNTDFRAFVIWLRQFNLQRGAGAHPVAIHGMDLYQVSPSIGAVIAYLARTNPEAAARARDRYMCLDSGEGERPVDGVARPRWPAIDCGQPVQDQLTELASGALLPEPGVVSIADSAYLDALQNARVVRNAEEYFRALLDKPESSWDLRDTHMASSVDLLLAHLDAATGTRSRLVIWAHNAHIGDARATARGDAGGLNLAQLLRERYPGDAFSVGFTTARGTVRAATDWGGPDMRKRLRRPLPGSHAAAVACDGTAAFLPDP